MKTTYRMNSRTIVSSALAVVLALSSTAALGRAMSGANEDDVSNKNQACGSIGCRNGDRLCGSIGGKVGVNVPPFTGEVSVSWTCYEDVFET